MALNQRQILFIKHYITSNNIAESINKAGYKSRTPSSFGISLLKRKEIKQEIARLQEEIAKSLEITTEWITQKIRDIADNGNNQEKLRALELLGKWKGLFKEQSINVALFDGSGVKQLLANNNSATNKLPTGVIDI